MIVVACRMLSHRALVHPVTLRVIDTRAWGAGSLPLSRRCIRHCEGGVNTGLAARHGDGRRRREFEVSHPSTRHVARKSEPWSREFRD
jgi:hypothetical protein